MNSDSDLAGGEETQDTMEDSLAVFIVPFILALGVSVFFVTMEIFRQVL
ncbi:MAG: hypothetical protein JW759_08865 [Candidatus Coatesbacteria bacterium]|nr:hypothetical protein [Candidatus Coatesbacteria bacterium]